MPAGIIVLIILGAGLVAIGAVMAFRGGRPMWWLIIFFGIIMLAASALAAIIPTL